MPSGRERITRTYQGVEIPISALALKALKAEGSSETGLEPPASLGELFSGAFFARDALEASLDMMEFNPKLLKDVLLGLVRYQGEENNQFTAEEVGKIHHEKRTRATATQAGQQIFDYLLTRYDHQRNPLAENGIHRVITYPAVDSTPLFLIVVENYVRLYGDDILHLTTPTRRGSNKTVWDAVIKAGTWVKRRMNQSQLGIFEHRNGSEHYWRDGRVSLADVDGSLPGWGSRVASLDQQILVLEAFKSMGRLLLSPELTENWCVELANRIRDVFWRPESGFFTPLVTIDNDHKVKQLQVRLADPTRIFDSSFFEYVSAEDKELMVSSVLQTLFDPKEFYTPFGVRARSIAQPSPFNYATYQGEWTVWFKENGHFFRGLIRQGYGGLARQLGLSMLLAVAAAGDFPEFVFVEPRPNPQFFGLRTLPLLSATADSPVIVATNVPDTTQLWTTSALALIKRFISGQLKSDGDKREQWEENLEATILNQLAENNLLATRLNSELIRQVQNNPPVYVDTDEGRIREKLWLENHMAS